MVPAASHEPVVSTASDYLELNPDRRYAIISQQFPNWLLAEPIEFPPHHDTYGWACRVERCDGTLGGTATQQLCVNHAKIYLEVKHTLGIDDFLARAEPIRALRFGWALTRLATCAVRGCPREVGTCRYCYSHGGSFSRARRREGFTEIDWAAGQKPLQALRECWISGCVHDASASRVVGSARRQICHSHAQQFNRWLEACGKAPREWGEFLESRRVVESLSPPSIRGQLSLAKLPASLQQEVRYALHRHANTARRSQWRPAELQHVVDALTAAGVQSLTDPEIAELIPGREIRSRQPARRIWLDVPACAASPSRLNPPKTQAGSIRSCWELRRSTTLKDPAANRGTSRSSHSDGCETCSGSTCPTRR